MIETKTLTAEIIQQLPHYKKRTQAGEYSAACPFCGEGEDRFRFWPEKGNYWCRRCDAKGFIDSPGYQLDPAKFDEWKRQEAARVESERNTLHSKLAALRSSGNVERYHQQLTDRTWWYMKGLTDATINRFRVGFTSNCPTAPGLESYTIPVTFGGKLYNIRHRIAGAANGNKYRPEMTGLPAAMFNADVLTDDSGFIYEVVLVEGEIKTMVLQQMGFDAVGIPGANVFKKKWLNLFANSGKRIYVALDPGAEDQAVKIWRQLSEVCEHVRLVTLPVKPDDFFVLYGGTPSDFFRWIQCGRVG